MNPYLIYAFDYRHASGGIKVLHRLCHEINQVGKEAYIGNTTKVNPEWLTPIHEPSFDREWIAIYPEVVTGNPWNAPHVVRWVLNVPGKLGGDRIYDASEIVFSWDASFLDAPILYVPALDLDIYHDRHEERVGEAYYVGKGQVTNEPPRGIEITLEMREDRYALASLLNSVSILNCYDDVTAMIDIARLCGCPVWIIPQAKRIEPRGALTEYIVKVAAFPDQLERFIQATQGYDGTT